MNTSKVGTILLSHQSSVSIAKMFSYWHALDASQDFLIAYGGEEQLGSSFDLCEVVTIKDPQLKTRDHPRERQSYLGVFQAAAEWVQQREITHVHFAEFDEIPLVECLNEWLLDLLERERCDVLAHRLLQVDQTNHPHYLNHVSDSQFLEYWRSISRRDDTSVVLSMLGCGSFWTKEAFLAVAALRPQLRMYLELFLPTAAHHLGFRLRNIPHDDVFMAPEIIKDAEELEAYRAKGAWRVHPVKNMWTRQS